MAKFMIGLLMGVGIGLLIAPEKGEDTRESLAETAENLKNTFNKLVGRAKTKLSDLQGILEHEIDGLSETSRARINTILAETEENDAYKRELKAMN